MARHSEGGTGNDLTDDSGLCGALHQRPIRCQNTVCPEQLHGVVALGEKKKQLGMGLAIDWEEGSPGMQPS